MLATADSLTGAWDYRRLSAGGGARQLAWQPDSCIAPVGILLGISRGNPNPKVSRILFFFSHLSLRFLRHELETHLGHASPAALRRWPSPFWSAGSTFRHGRMPHRLVMGTFFHPSRFSPPPRQGGMPLWCSCLLCGRSPVTSIPCAFLEPEFAWARSLCD